MVTAVNMEYKATSWFSVFLRVVPEPVPDSVPEMPSQFRTQFRKCQASSETQFRVCNPRQDSAIDLPRTNANCVIGVWNAKDTTLTTDQLHDTNHSQEKKVCYFLHQRQ